MEVAGQWRREWAGTAEYGKVTEGGVTRQVARAMEVLHASAPGARVRVLRAAYHSTAGPGAPSSSYLLHSSRRVISSGYNFIEPKPSQSLPLEISSTPLESSPELEIGNENYKVTEPDDFDISEPSKWRGSKSINSIRMPSEESSSTDNASIIDLDYNNKNSIRKTSEKFSPQNNRKRSSPISSLLDAPVTLSTLKFKSLLNGNDSWNNRRKSYSFEETPELHEPILKDTGALTMESSTDSGICKSSEIVNSDYHNSETTKYGERKNKMEDIHEETFKDWLSKNRRNQYTNPAQRKKEHVIDFELTDENNITLQSAGKVSITLPTTTKTNDYYVIKNDRASDDYDKKTKKVEFCKTELHFAAESGTVNIIATDEKPPPSNDFRKKRSMFVPMTSSYDKSITLFGEKKDVFNVNIKGSSGVTNEINTIDENTAATKGILKNKIPKPKPYLLGENMVFGDSINRKSDTKDDTSIDYTKPTGVSLINKQLENERKLSNESRSSTGNESDWSPLKKPTNRTNEIGPVDNMRSNQNTEQRFLKKPHIENDVSDSIKTKVKILQMSPTLSRARTRELRESDLTYFGLTKTEETQKEKRKHSLDSIYDENNLREEILHSVQLVKLISNSVCNSEVDSDDAPDYENVPMKDNSTLKPAPRSRSKYQSYLEGNREQKDLNPILEKDDEPVMVESRRLKVKKHSTSTNRSLSEPRKAIRQKYIESPNRVLNKPNEMNYSSSSKNNAESIEKRQNGKKSAVKVSERGISESPVYVNLGTKETAKISDEKNYHNETKQSSIKRQKSEKKCLVGKDDSGHTQHIKNKRNYDVNNFKDATKQRIDSEKQKVEDHDSGRKKPSVHRTKVLVTPEKTPIKCREASPKKHRNTEKGSFREKKVTNHTIQKISTKAEQPESKDLNSNRDSKNKTSCLKTEVKMPNTQKNSHKISTDTTNTENSLKESQEVHSNVIVVAEIIKSQPKAKKSEKMDKADIKPRRSKYVINYDDKNGTVSSICKIRPDHGSTKSKQVVNYDNTDNIRGHEYKNKINSSVNKNSSANKNNLLQLPDQQRILYGNSKVKPKYRARQSCQIL